MGENERPVSSFRREMKQNYLMIAADERLEQRFETRMLERNIIDGLLKFRVRREDDHCWFCYEITSRQPLARLLERQPATAAQLRKLLSGIVRTLGRMEDYLLAEELLLLDPDLIYVDPEDFQPGLCLLPGRKGDFPREFSAFLQFLLGRTDHQDKEAVVLIYGLYQESLKENYGLESLMRRMAGNDRSGPEYPDMEEDPADRESAQEAHPEMEQMEVRRDEGVRNEKSERSVLPPPSSAGKYPLAFVILPVLAAAVLWMWKGMAGILSYGAVVIGAAAALGAAGAGFCLWKRSVRTGIQKEEDRQGSGPAEQGNPWEMMFAGEEAEETEEADELAPAGPAGEAAHTTLLWSRAPQTDIRRLTGDAGTQETIPVSYYPFLIGKQENLADYVLRYDTISRLHVRIDRREDSYWLTDLNSTNGTAVNGRFLEANETVKLEIGDRVDMAELRFRFQ